MARKKRNRSASDIGAVSVPEGSESIAVLNEGEDMEEQELCACGNLAEACECKHKCEFECNDEECIHQEVQAVVEEVAVEPEPVAEVAEQLEELPVAEPEVVVAVAEPVVVPVVSQPAPVVPVAAPQVAQTAEGPVAGPSQTASKFASILGEKSSAVSRYLGGRGTRY